MAVIWPEKVNLTFSTAPSNGLTLYLDGIAGTSPFTVGTLIGFNHTIEARNQTVGTNLHKFHRRPPGALRCTSSRRRPLPRRTRDVHGDARRPHRPRGRVGLQRRRGTSAADSSGNGNTATLLNGVAWDTGKYGSGLSFDGANDYLSVPNSPSLNVSGNALTLSMWVNPNTASTGDHVLLGKHGTPP